MGSKYNKEYDEDYSSPSKHPPTSEENFNDQLNEFTNQFSTNDNQSNSQDLEFQFSHMTADDPFYLSEETKALRVEEMAKDLQVSSKKILIKIDLFVLIPFCFLFFISNLNRSVFALLWTGGITETLKLSELQFFASISAFYCPYVLLQAFSNLMIKSVRPHFWMSICVLMYGAVVLGEAFVQNYASLIICQILHGIFQSSCDSAIYYIIGHYYERRESQKRVSLLYSFSILAVIVNTAIILGVDRNLMESKYEPWRWLLIINGSITMFASLILFFILPDFPEGVRFFSDSEVLFIIKRLELYSGKSGYNMSFSIQDVLEQIKDPMIWVPTIVSNLYGAVAISYTLVQYVTMVMGGTSLDEGFKISIYQYLAAYFSCMCFGFISDFIQLRSVPLVISTILTIYGLLAICFAKSTSLVDNPFTYRSDWFFIVGSYASFPLLIGWVTFNLNGHLRKSIITSLMVSSYDLAGIYTNFVLYKPTAYFQSVSGTAAGFSIASLIGVLIYLIIIHNQNKRKRTALYKDQFVDLTERQKILAGDRNPLFDYMY